MHTENKEAVRCKSGSLFLALPFILKKTKKKRAFLKIIRYNSNNLFSIEYVSLVVPYREG